LIDIKLGIQDYPSINLENLIEKNPDIDDNIKNSIILYNKALESISSGSEDIAIIELKKAVSMNPDFYEAMNLLGLCYGYVGDNERAVEMFQNVIDAESNSVKALKYMDMLGMEDGYPVKTKGRKTTLARRKALSEKEAGDSPSVYDSLKVSGRRDILKYMVGMTIGALLVFFLVLLKIPDSNTDLVSAAEEEKTRLSDELAQYKSKYEKLNDEYKALQKDIEASNAGIDYLKSVNKLHETENLFLRKEYENAADLLILLKMTEFKGQDKEKYDKLYNEVLPIAANRVFDEGINLFNSMNKYEESLKKLNKVQLYNPDFDKTDKLLYYTGKCYQAMNDTRRAIAEYQKIIDEHPQSSYVYWARVRLEELSVTTTP